MKKKILVVDDEKAIRNSFILTFEESEYEIDTASSALAGISKVEDNDYELIFLDLKMPEMNGVEALKRIKQLKNNIPIYIITAFHKDFFGELEQAASEGYEFELLQKPLNSDQLVGLVDGILNNVQSK